MRIAIIRLSAMGDIVHTVGFTALIKQRFPHSTIEWYVDSQFAELLTHHPHIGYIHALPLKESLKRFSFAQLASIVRYLKAQEPYDIVIDMQGLIKSALVGFFLKGETWGFDRHSARESLAALFYDQKVGIGYERHILERNAYLMSFAMDCEWNRESLLDKSPALGHSEEMAQKAATFLPPNQKNVVFILGASKVAKKYPRERFAEVAGLLDVHVIPLWYTDEEKADAAWIGTQYVNCTVPQERNLDFAKALIAQADLVIGGDTGLAHAAWAMNTPSITLFGNTPLERFCLKTEKNVCLSVSHVDKSKGFDQNDFSIRQISPQMVGEKAKELLG